MDCGVGRGADRRMCPVEDTNLKGDGFVCGAGGFPCTLDSVGVPTGMSTEMGFSPVSLFRAYFLGERQGCGVGEQACRWATGAGRKADWKKINPLQYLLGSCYDVV